MAKIPRSFIVIAGHICFVVGIIGGLIPNFPGIVFLALAVICYKKGSPRIMNWVYQLPLIGESIINFEKDGSLPLKSKLGSVIMFFPVAVGVHIFLSSTLWSIVSISFSMLITGYILTRPTAKMKMPPSTE